MECLGMASLHTLGWLKRGLAPGRLQKGRTLRGLEASRRGLYRMDFDGICFMFPGGGMLRSVLRPSRTY